jgi:hypothetical protein
MQALCRLYAGSMQALCKLYAGSIHALIYEGIEAVLRLADEVVTEMTWSHSKHPIV